VESKNIILREKPIVIIFCVHIYLEADETWHMESGPEKSMWYPVEFSAKLHLGFRVVVLKTGFLSGILCVILVNLPALIGCSRGDVYLGDWIHSDC